MTSSDVQALFLDKLGVSLGEEMVDYLVRRFQEGGAAAAPLAPARRLDVISDQVRRFAELADMLGHGAAVPAEVPDPVVH